MAKFLPHNVQRQLCEPLVVSAVENIDWCSTAEEKGCYPEEVVQEESENVDVQELVESLNILSTNQETIYNQMNSSFVQLDNYYADLQQMMFNLSNICSVQQQYYVEPVYVEEEPVIDEREQQRLELQAQIEALQNEMNNLY